MANVITPAARASFPHLFKPAINKQEPTKDPRYSLSLLFPKDADLSALKASVNAILTEKFGTKEKFPKNLRSPFRDQGEKEFAGYEEGNVFINAWTKSKPGLVGPDLKDLTDETQIYAGCWVRASVKPFYYDTNGNKGVAFMLNNVQKVKDGEPLDGRVRAAEEFEAVEAAAAADDFDPFA